MVGILTFASADANTGAEVQGFNFIVPISIVREFLDRGNVRPARSLFDDTYDAALASYHEAHYRKALDLFSQIDRMSPGHPYVGQYITLSQKAVDEGRDRWWITGWWSWVAMLVIAGIIGYAARRRLMLRRSPAATVRVLPN